MVEAVVRTIKKAPMVQNNISIPVAIVIAGALIAGAVFYTNGGTNNPDVYPPEVAGGNLDAMTTVSSSDHIRGNPDAPVKIVEYSDFECPFCKAFHATLQKTLKEHGDHVAWVYRHFPLEQLHPLKAQKEAVATECANEQGGNDAFWKYTDRFFELTPSNNQTDIDTVLPQIAKEIGLDVTKFNECLASSRYDDHIEGEVQNAIATGGNGTPWSIVVSKSGKKYPLSGAQSYEVVTQLVDVALQDK